MKGIGAIIQTKTGGGVFPNIPTGIDLVQEIGPLPNIPTGIIAIFNPDIPDTPTGISLIEI